ncbi:MAG: ferredoxin [Ktedonobacteraceae bacterium]|nr:ferredoxin [Ktedonobacteraceae bacterium]
MRILVDLNRCQSYGQCCFASPHVFRFHNGEALEYDPAPDDALREQVVRAARACPVQAIYIGLDDAYEALPEGEHHDQQYQ